MENGSLLSKMEATKDVIRDKETEMEAALYGNCLLLGLDASILGQGAGSRAGLFRHSNPRVGEALLHFLLSALRGPSLAAKDFAGVWPIFDAAQSRDFRKIVQGLINELEAQGALPRSSSRVSSLATCCGQRFVELLWQLSAHALREVHRRNFPADVAENPLPASLTEVITQNSHASALLAVTKARIALERRRFLQGASAAVHKQALWSSLAHDMTAEYRALCAEEAYLHQELEKMQELQSSRAFANQKVTSASRATTLWESLLKHTERHDKLASGPIEDLIAHRDHRYRIDGSALRVAIDRGMNVIPSSLNSNDDGCNQQLEKQETSAHGDEARTDRAVKGSSPLDVAEVIRRWTHALQRIHKQAQKLSRQNQGTGPNLINAVDACEGHTQALRATLAEQKQHLSNMQVLIAQLKEAIPGMEANINKLRQHVNHPAVSSASQAVFAGYSVYSDSALSSQDVTSDCVADDRGTPGPLELAPPSPTLKLPQLPTLSSPFSLLHKGGDDDDLDLRPSSLAFSDHKDYEDDFKELRQAVHDAALSKPVEAATENTSTSNTTSEHYFTPLTVQKESVNRAQATRSSPPLFLELSGFQDQDDDLLVISLWAFYDSNPAPLSDMDSALI
ncbi:hypothetical protein SELMODRAFT_437244 [Selaginella moellendorffii]|uniref:HAUS augmin-like complex subunit 6 N-terminal domain-containing protein n=1 Tax=Selaginella moellendorffii TaxID=88036 RepID=D8QPL6_SELML|nr:hypothetical protein SELMODRAFT_437244 [Selaginella moellendorffii]